MFRFLTSFFLLLIWLVPALPAFSAAAPTNAAGASVKRTAPAAPAMSVAALDLVHDPDRYLNKRVAFEGTFNSFSSLGLDYKKALRDAKQYVSLLILRPDVSHHNIPLAELKMFYPRQKSESLMTLDQGDRVAIEGTVFSTALGEPWLDIQQVKILQKSKKADKSKPATLKGVDD